jgi:hypothetical protein
MVWELNTNEEDISVYRTAEEIKNELRYEGRLEGKLEDRTEILNLLKKGITIEELEKFLTEHPAGE